MIPNPDADIVAGSRERGEMGIGGDALGWDVMW